MAKKKTQCCGGKIVGIYRRREIQGFMCGLCQQVVKNDGTPIAKNNREDQ